MYTDMPRETLVCWYCWRGHRNNGGSPHCAVCGTSRIEKHAQVHEKERAVVYYNPLTGEHRTPPRADMPMPAVYAQQGYERRDILNMTQYERETGVVHEATNFNPGNEPLTDRDPMPPSHKPEVIRELARDMAEAMASGPWTGTDLA